MTHLETGTARLSNARSLPEQRTESDAIEQPPLGHKVNTLRRSTIYRHEAKLKRWLNRLKKR